MKCKQCGKNVRSISHWAREHKKWLASRKRKPRKSKAANPRKRKKGLEREISHAEKVVGWHYCPMCGRRCG